MCIAVGMATKIPPHNLGELISGLNALLDNPEITIDELYTNHISGPDFPTGGVIVEEQANILERKASNSARPLPSVSYTHLTLPTNREV